MLDPEKNAVINEKSDAVTVAVGFPTSDERYVLGKALHDALCGEQDYVNSAILLNIEDQTPDGDPITDECGQPRLLVVNARSDCKSTKIEVCFRITKEDGTCIMVEQDGSKMEFSYDKPGKDEEG